MCDLCERARTDVERADPPDRLTHQFVEARSGKSSQTSIKSDCEVRRIDDLPRADRVEHLEVGFDFAVERAVANVALAGKVLLSGVGARDRGI